MCFTHLLEQYVLYISHTKQLVSVDTFVCMCGLDCDRRHHVLSRKEEVYGRILIFAFSLPAATFIGSGGCQILEEPTSQL